CEYACSPQTPGAEACDGEDNDCNGVTDDGFDTNTDPDNCGMCGTVCTMTAGAASVECSGGACAVSGCNANLQDCDGDYANGCEADLTTVDHCGACNNACDFGPNTVATCGAMGCEYAGCAMGF